MIGLDHVLHNTMRNFGESTYRKFLCSEIIYHWEEIVSCDIAQKITPVTLEHGVLFVRAKSAAHQDQLKFYSAEIIEDINEIFKENPPLVNEIRIAKTFQISRKQEAQIQIKPVSSELKIEDIHLTIADKKLCAQKAKKISDERLRKTVFNTLLTQLRLKKFHTANGWHKCRHCEALCPPEEIFCEVCKVKTRSNMFEELYRILYDEPWIKTSVAQQKLLKKMPFMHSEISLEVIESARTSLIQKIAAQIRFGDVNSPLIQKIVMLEKRLRPELLTLTIIQHTLVDLQFNFIETRKFQRYNALKVSNK